MCVCVCVCVCGCRGGGGGGGLSYFWNGGAYVLIWGLKFEVGEIIWGLKIDKRNSNKFHSGIMIWVHELILIEILVKSVWVIFYILLLPPLPFINESILCIFSVITTVLCSHSRSIVFGRLSLPKVYPTKNLCFDIGIHLSIRRILYVMYQPRIVGKMANSQTLTFVSPWVDVNCVLVLQGPCYRVLLYLIKKNWSATVICFQIGFIIHTLLP